MSRVRSGVGIALVGLVLSACLGSADSGDEDESQGVVKLRFVSLAWQEQAVAANHRIVDEWNRTHPNIEVEYVQGDWESQQDFMLTSFESGDVPDVFHFWSAGIIDWAQRGYLADLSGIISEDFESDVVDDAWATVQAEEGGIYGVPFLWESLVTLYNADAFEDAGVEPPTIEDPWTWEELRAAAKELTIDTDGDGTPEQYGAAIGLKAPVDKTLNLSMNYDGRFFYEENGDTVVEVGDAEKRVPQTIHDMIYVDESTSPDGVNLEGPDLMPGFFRGKYAMLPAIGIWARQQVVEGAPDGFEWGTLPPLMGDSQTQGSATQTLSIPADSPNKEEAMQFIEYFLKPASMAELAKGDWVLPTSESAGARMEQFEGEGWDIAADSLNYLTLAPFQTVKGINEWTDKVASPALESFYANKISWEEVETRLEGEGNAILERYR